MTATKAWSKRNLRIGGAFVLALAALGACQSVFDRQADSAAGTGVIAPVFEVDPLWPKPLPQSLAARHRRSASGSTRRTTSGSFIAALPRSQRTNARSNWAWANAAAARRRCSSSIRRAISCARGAAPARATNGPSRITASTSTTRVTSGSVATAPKDAHILKFTKDGKFVMQIGSARQERWQQRSRRTSAASRKSRWIRKPTRPTSQTATEQPRRGARCRHRQNEALLGRLRQQARRHGPRQIRSRRRRRRSSSAIRCIASSVSNDSLIYVCDRQDDRIQVFTPDGKFVKEAHYARETLGTGSIWDIAFSKDPQQSYIFLADGTNEKVRVILRETLTEITNFGDGGRQPGQFYGVHSIAIDSKGNLYTTETYEGKRLQKFVYKGMGTVAREQGVLWPRAR